tara:strand:- start:12308 stop:13054 length:747 start_codon:yes stop_codon:yes gene_type:complete
MNYIKNERMLNLIKGKRVAIVGPSPHLLENNLGSYIDEYDLVCRINNDIYPRGYEKDYGSRTDIISWAGDTRYCANFAKNLEANKEIVKNIEIVFLSTIKAQHDWKGSVVENFKSANKGYKLPYDYIGSENYQLALREFGVEPNSGQMTVWMFLQYPIKELLVTGFSFYNQFNKAKEVKASFYNHDMIYSATPLAPTHNPLAGHNQEEQKRKFINQLYTYSNIIKIDSYLNALLGINHLNVKKLDKNE